jgi:hypothetical protein
MLRNEWQTPACREDSANRSARGVDLPFITLSIWTCMQCSDHEFVSGIRVNLVAKYGGEAAYAADQGGEYARREARRGRRFPNFVRTSKIGFRRPSNLVGEGHPIAPAVLGQSGTRPRKGRCREERTADGQHGRELWVSHTCPRNGSGLLNCQDRSEGWLCPRCITSSTWNG